MSDGRGIANHRCQQINDGYKEYTVPYTVCDAVHTRLPGGGEFEAQRLRKHRRLLNRFQPSATVGGKAYWCVLQRVRCIAK